MATLEKAHLVTDIASNATTQNLYRAVNERVMELNARFDASGDTIRSVEVLCECGRVSCAARLSIASADYERVRSDPSTFVLIPGHEDAAVEEVIERTADFVIARNVGEADAIARAGDPRRAGAGEHRRR